MSVPDEELVVLFHGLVMNGGLMHAVDAVDVARDEVVRAYADAGLREVADLITGVTEESDDADTDTYSDLIPSDAALGDALDAAAGEG